MVQPAKLRHLYESVMHNISSAENPVRGDFVECGVWRGGATMMMLFAEQAALARNRKPAHRDVWLFDTFEGMTMPECRYAHDYAHNTPFKCGRGRIRSILRPQLGVAGVHCWRRNFTPTRRERERF